MQVYRILAPNTNISKDKEGTLVLPGQKITVASSEEIGGEGEGLEYMYFAKSIDHLGKI